jgi:hypothetical protein
MSNKPTPPKSRTLCDQAAEGRRPRKGWILPLAWIENARRLLALEKARRLQKRRH